MTARYNFSASGSRPRLALDRARLHHHAVIARLNAVGQCVFGNRDFQKLHAFLALGGAERLEGIGQIQVGGEPVPVEGILVANQYFFRENFHFLEILRLILAFSHTGG
jgi:hypothetical protein